VHAWLPFAWVSPSWAAAAQPGALPVMGASLCAEPGCKKSVNPCEGNQSSQEYQQSQEGRGLALRDAVETVFQGGSVSVKSGGAGNVNFNSLMGGVGQAEQVIGAKSPDAAHGLHKGFDLAKHGVLEISSLVHTNHLTVRGFVHIIALALLTSSVLGVINLFSAIFKPFQYLFACYNVMFAVVILVMDGKAGLFACSKFGDPHQLLFSAFPAIASQMGRALLYLYVGSLNLVMLPETTFWKIIYVCIGGSLSLAGVIMMLHYCHRFSAGGLSLDVHSTSKQHMTPQQLLEAASQDATKSVANAASQGAQQGAAFGKAEFTEIRSYIHAMHPNHFSVKLLCFVIGLALLASSSLSLINIFGILFEPFHYLVSFYNLGFAVIILVLDGNPDSISRHLDLHAKLLSAAPCLASQTGRALLYFYVGSMNLVMLPDSFLWKVVYLAIGGSLCLAAFLMLVHTHFLRAAFDHAWSLKMVPSAAQLAVAQSAAQLAVAQPPKAEP